MVKAAYEYVGPVYIRFGRAAVPVFHEEEGYTFEIGKGEVLQDGTDVAIIANGLMVAEAIEAGKILAEAGISARIINMATIKPLDEELVLKAARSAARSSPVRSTTSWAAWVRLSVVFWPRSAPPPCAASASTTSLATPVPLPLCSSSSVSPRSTSWRSPKTSAASNLCIKSAPGYCLGHFFVLF